jgi:Bacteriocin-protection, YdeI or OmpD-Associated/Domain of unknown function (DUF1905)
MEANKKLTFSTILLQAGKTATGIEIPDEIIESLGAGKKPPVKVTINGFTYRSTVAVMGGVFMVGVNAENRIGAKINGGDAIEVAIELDTEKRVVVVPPDFQEILDNNLAAKKKFETLSYTNQKEMVISIADAKTEETKQKRIAKALGSLLETKK